MGAEGPLWQAMTSAERARAYSPSTMVGDDLGPFITAYQELSAQAYAQLDVFTLAYGDAPSQTLDITVPQGADPVPLHVFIHGGYWQELSKTESFFAAPDTVQHGVAFAALDYTLAPHATVEDITAEVITALRHLRTQAPSLGIDPTRIVVSGSSAGAHLAALSCARMEVEDRPAGLILLSGIYDLRPLVETYINDALGLDMPRAAALSPGLHGVSDMPPTLVAWGEVETPEFKRQSRWFAGLLRDAQCDVHMLEVPGRNHFDIPFDLANDSALGAWMPSLAGVVGLRPT